MNLITYKNWESLTISMGGQLWETGKPLPTSNLVFSTCDHVSHLFRHILEDQNYTHKFTLISGASDFGPAIQASRPPLLDLQRWFPMQSIAEQGYRDLIVRARCDVGNCLQSDKYSMRGYSWTASTFPVIPSNIVRWYCTNSSIEDERVVPIPFGIHPDAVSNIKKYKDYSGIKQPKFVAAWSNTTNERAQLQSLLMQFEECYTDHVDPSVYFQRLASSKFCICPEGNGLDSYRVLEALYMGCVPIIVSNGNPTWVKAYEKICDLRPFICKPQELHSIISKYAKPPLDFGDVIDEPLLNIDSKWLSLESWIEYIGDNLGNQKLKP